MSSGSEWRPLIEDQRGRVQRAIGQEDYDSSQSNVFNARSFRKAFEAYCKTKREFNYDRLQSRLMPSYDAILDLARAVDRSAPDLKQNDTENLETLIWMLNYVLICRGFQACSQMESSTTLTADLNKTVPQFSTQKIDFPTVTAVQQPLQKVFQGYIQSVLETLSHFSQLTPPRNLSLRNEEKVKDLIRRNTQDFQILRGEYDQAVNQAAQDLEREKAAKERHTLDEEGEKQSIIHPESSSNRITQVVFVSSDREPLGKGSFGEVDEVREKSTGAVYARKHIHLLRSGRSAISDEEVNKEVAAMQKLHHRHIATVLFHCKDVEEQTFSIFMLPVADCNLKTYLEDCVKSEFDVKKTQQIVHWFGCLLDALAYAHLQKIIHRDIKPSNILIKHHQPYLTDFGLAKDFEEADDSSSVGDVVQGTPAYRAPELKPGSKRNKSTDIFSLGCTYSEMLTVTESRSLGEYIKARDGRAFRDCLPEVNEWLRMLEKDTHSRLTEIMIGEILDMVAKDASKRPDALTLVGNLKQDHTFWCVETGKSQNKQ